MSWKTITGKMPVFHEEEHLMARMGYAYGSECHLLRWMGRHRRAFDAAVGHGLSDRVHRLFLHVSRPRAWTLPDTSAEISTHLRATRA